MPLLLTLAALLAAAPELVVQTSHDYAPEVFALSPDGRTMAAANFAEHSVHLWDLATLQVVRVLPTGQQDRLVYSADGRFLAVLHGDGAQIFDVTDGRTLERGGASSSAGLAFDPDNGGFIFGDRHAKGAVLHYRFGQKSLFGAKVLETEPFDRLEAALGNGRALLVSATSLGLVELQTAKLLARVASPLSGKQDWAFTAGGRILMGISEEAIVLLDPATLQEKKRLPLPAGEGKEAPSVFRGLLGKHAFAAARGQLFRVDAESLALVSHRPGAGEQVVSHDGRIALAGHGNFSLKENATFTVLDGYTGRPLSSFGGSVSEAPRVQFDADGRLLWVSPAGQNGNQPAQGSSSRIIDLARASEVLNRPATLQALSPDGRHARMNDDQLVELATGKSVKLDFSRLLPDSHPERSMAFSPDSRWLAVHVRAFDPRNYAKKGEGVGLFDVKAGEAVFYAPGASQLEESFVFSPDSTRVAFSQGPKAFEIRELPSGKKLGEGQGGMPRAFSRDGSLLLLANEFRDPVGAVDGLTGAPRDMPPATVPRGDLPENTIQPLDLARRWDVRPWAQLRETLAGRRVAAASGDGKIAALPGYDGPIALVDVATGVERGVLRGHTGQIRGLTFSPDGRRLLSYGADRLTILWNVEKAAPIVTIAMAGQKYQAAEELALVTPEGYFMGQRAATRSIAVRIGMRAYPIGQFDTTLNRPDLVLQRLGQAPPETVAFYRAAHERRLAKLGLKEEAGLDYQLPEVRVVREQMPATTDAERLTLRVETDERGAPAVGFQVVANGVPLFGPLGDPGKPDGKAHLLDVLLAAGDNRLEVTAVDARGRESSPDWLNVRREAPAKKPHLYALMVGVSDYRDPAYKLRYAAKDAKDLLAQLQSGGRIAYAEVHGKALLDGEATRENIAAARAFLDQAAVDDVVLVFFAGHGLLDTKAGYFFATADMEFEQPASRGLSFDAMEGLVTGLRARHRLMLVDTCAAGETDEDEVARRSGAVAKGVQVASRGVKRKPAGGSASSAASGELLLTRELFSSLRRGSGATVIGSSSGVEYAFESAKLANGVFTHALLEKLKNQIAYENQVRVSRLQYDVIEKVTELTAGLQHPVARQANPEDDFVVWRTPEPPPRKARKKRR